MTTRSAGETELDSCLECGGMFLDRGELNTVAEPTAGDLEYSTLHDESFEHDDEFGPIACPRCGVGPMGKVEFNIYTGIILDHCAACHGFWMDGPELKRIDVEVRRLNDEASDGPGPVMLWFANFIWSLPR
ncbi:MAG: zf-TFIIB domain-containing protein [bacterium]|nr:zf-TFIIB domain-containing protein [bacterium]